MAILRNRLLNGKPYLLSTTAASGGTGQTGGDDTGVVIGTPGVGSGGTTAPAPAVTAITLSPASGTAGSAAGTVIGTLAATITNGPLVNPVWTLTNSAGGDFQIVNGNQVAVLPSNVPAGSYTITAQVAASNLATPFNQAVTVAMAATQSGGATTPPASSATYTPMTDIAFSQPMPTNSTLNENTLNAKPVVATFAPVGGIGPFVFECLNADGTEDGSGYTALSYRSSILGLAYDRSIGRSDIGWIVSPGDSSRSATRLLRITDASGAPPVTKQVVIDTSMAAKRLWISANGRTLYQDMNPYAVSWYVYAWNGSAFDAPSVISIKSDPTGGFTFNNQAGILSFAYVGQWPLAVGTYSIVMAAAGYADQTLTFQVQAGSVSDPVFLPTPGIVPNTAMPPYTPIGQLGYTSALNAAGVTVSDPTGALVYDLTTNSMVMRAAPSTAGTIAAQIGLTELDPGGNATYAATKSRSLSITLAQGTAISSSAMVMTGLTTTFNNDTYYNVLGTIPVPAGIDASKATWRIVSQTGYTRRAEKNLYGANPARYQIARATSGGGYLTANAMLSAGTDGVSAATDSLLISCTDGTAVCTAPLAVTVNWAAQSRAIYIGAGMASAHGGNGFEKWWDFMFASFTTYAGLANPSAAHAGTWDVYISANADPDYYATITGQADRYPIQGPIRLHGIADGSGNLPRIGGVIANNVPTPLLSKGPIRFGDGDALIEMVEASCVHGSNQGDQRGGIYKDGSTYGNVTIRKCVVRDVANGILGGHIHGAIVIDQTELSHSGTETGGAGPAHGIYLDDASSVTITNNYFRLGNYGHLLKSRGTNQVIKNNRIIAGLGGSSSACIDMPDGGVCEVAFNDIEQGPNAESLNVIQWGLEALSYSADSPYDVNSLYVHDNRINGMLLAGQHFGGPSNMMKHARFLNRFGEPVQFVRFENNTCWIAPNPASSAPPGEFVGPDPNVQGGGQFVSTLTQWTTVGPAVSIVGNTIAALPFIASTARPYLPGNMPALGGLEYHYSYNDNYKNFETVWQYGDRDQISVSASAGEGVTLAVLRATNDLDAQGRGTPNPFGAGSHAAIIMDGNYYGLTPWAAAGKYKMVDQADGSSQLQTGPTARTSGVDFVQVRFTAPNGTLSDIRYAVMVTA